MTTTDLAELRKTRERLAQETARQHRKMLKYRKQMLNAQRAYQALEGQHAIIDRQIFELDPGITIVKPFLIPDRPKPYKDAKKTAPITADTMKNTIGDEMMKEMLRAAIAKKQAMTD